MENKIGYMIIEIKTTKKDRIHFVFSSENVNVNPYKTKDECRERLDLVLSGFKESHEKYGSNEIVVSKRLSDDSYCFGFENKKSKGMNYVIFQIVEVVIP